MSAEPRDGLYTTAQAAATLSVPASLIRKWKHHKRAMPAGVVPAAVPGGLQPLYELDELRPLAEAYHRRRAGRVG